MRLAGRAGIREWDNHRDPVLVAPVRRRGGAGRPSSRRRAAPDLPDPCAPLWRASSLVVLTLRGDRVSMLTRFGDLGLLARFGLPRTLPRD